MSWEIIAVGALLAGLVLGMGSRSPRREPERVMYVEREETQPSSGCLPMIMFIAGVFVAVVVLGQA